MSSRHLAWGFVGVAALTLLGFLAFLHYYEPVVEQEPVALKGEARRNPNLAAMRFLERLGFKTAAQPPLLGEAALPPVGEALLITASREALSEDWRQRLEDWVRGGGRLIVAAAWRAATVTPPAADDGDGADTDDADDAAEAAAAAAALADPLLNRFGVHVTRLLPGAGRGAPTGFDADVPEAADFLRMQLDGRLRLRAQDPAAVPLAEDAAGAVALRLPVGRGTLTVLTAADLFSNRRIGEQDHAAFLAALVWGAPRVWFAYDNDMPPLPQWLWRQAPLLWLSLALLLALWLWRAVPRFGPLRDLPPPARRRLLEHVEAGARFLWRQRRSGALLAAMRRGFDDALRRRHPGQHDAAALAALTRLPRERILALFNARPGRDREQFTAQVRLYQKLISRL